MNDTTRDKLVGEGLPVPPVVPVIPTTTAALGGHRSPDQPLHNITFFAVIPVVLGRNIAPPLLKLVISPFELCPGNRAEEYLFIPTRSCLLFLFFSAVLPKYPISPRLPSHHQIAV